MALLGLVVVLFVVRPLVRRILTPDEPRAAASRRGRRRDRRRRTCRPRSPPAPTRRRHRGRARARPAKMIDMAQVQGQVHAQSMQKVGELAERNPQRNRVHHPPMAARTRQPDRPWPSARKTGTTSRNEIADLVATLAGRQTGKAPGRKLTGPERAAVLMLALGEQHGGKIWKLLDDDELRELSIVMSTLGTVEAESVENLLLEFVGRLSASGALMGNYDATERLLQQYLPPDRVADIMEEIRGPAGRNMWEKLSNVQEQVLANYLKNEYPQTVAVVLSKIRPEHAARVLAILPEELALDVVDAHAEDGSGAEGSDRAGREHAAHRIHVEPVADPPARRARGDGGDLQQFRPPDRDALHDRAGGAEPREPPSASRR